MEKKGLNTVPGAVQFPGSTLYERTGLQASFLRRGARAPWNGGPPGKGKHSEVEGLLFFLSETELHNKT